MAGWSIYGAPSMPKAKSLTLLSRASGDKWVALKLQRKLLEKMAFAPDKSL